MTSKIVILFAAFLLIKGLSAQYLGYGNLQNGLPANNFASNLAQTNLASNLYGANNFANAYGANNLAANNLVSSTAALAGNNIGFGQNLASNIVSNNFAGQNLATNVASNNLLGQSLAVNSLSGANNFAGQNLATNLASNNLLGQNLAVNGLSSTGNIASTAGLLEGITASNGGVFSVTSSSPIIPKGISVFSDNLLIEGPLSVSGQLPFLSAVAVEGSVPTSGQGAASCGCGDGNIGVVNELNNAGMYGGLGRQGLGRY